MGGTAWALEVLRVVETVLRLEVAEAVAGKIKLAETVEMDTLRYGIPYRSELCL